MHVRSTLLGAAATFAFVATAAPAHAAPGVRHVVADYVSAPNWTSPITYELWYHQDGTGWRMRQTGILGTTTWVANRKGMKITIAKGSRGGPAGTTFMSRQELLNTPRKGDFPDAPSMANYLTRLPKDIAFEPMARVARGELKIAGETLFNGEPAYELVDAKGNPHSAHIYAAKDDGAPLAERGEYSGLNVRVYELLPARSANRR